MIHLLRAIVTIVNALPLCTTINEYHHKIFPGTPSPPLPTTYDTYQKIFCNTLFRTPGATEEIVGRDQEGQEGQG